MGGSIALSTARAGTPTWLTGGTFGPEGSLLALTLIAAVTVAALVRVGRPGRRRRVRPPTTPPPFTTGAVAEYVITAASRRATPELLDVPARYPRAPKGRTGVSILMERLDAMLRDPAPNPRIVDDPGPFFHGTRADLRPGELLTPGRRSNYGLQRRAKHIYLNAAREGASLAAARASGDGPGRVYRVEPLGMIQDDPNVTDKRFPGNPSRSYRTTEPLRVLEEITGWDPPPPAMLQNMRERLAELTERGIEAMDD